MTRPGRYPQELRERAVRLVLEHQDEHPSQWAAICSIAHQFGVSAETLRKWVRRAEAAAGLRPGLTSDEHQRLKTWSVRSASCGGPMGSSSPRRLSWGRSSTADRPDDRLPPRPQGPLRVEPICRVLPIAPSTYLRRQPPTRLGPPRCATPSSRARSPGSTPSSSGSTAPARSGGSCTGKGSRWLAAPWSGCWVSFTWRASAAARPARPPRPMRPPLGQLTWSTAVAAQRPNQLWVADLTYVATWSGFV
jgi:hypothetical protein